MTSTSRGHRRPSEFVRKRFYGTTGSIIIALCPIVRAEEDDNHPEEVYNDRVLGRLSRWRRRKDDADRHSKSDDISAQDIHMSFLVQPVTESKVAQAGRDFFLC